MPVGRWPCTCGTIAENQPTAVAPWFSPDMWHGGGYLQVHRSVGNLIDWVRRGLFYMGF